MLKEKEDHEDFVWKKNWDLNLRRGCRELETFSDCLGGVHPIVVARLGDGELPEEIPSAF